MLVFASVALTGCSLQYQQRRQHYDRDGRDSYPRNHNQRDQHRYQHHQRGQMQNGNYHDERSNFHN